MIKTIIASLLVAFATFSNCNRTERPTNGSPSPAPSGSEALAQAPVEVEILFSGLMVFQEEGDRSGYKVGVLRPIDGKHNFTVDVDSTNMTHLLPKTENSWTIEIAGSSETSPIEPVEKNRPKKRRPDEEGHQHDFGWIIDLQNEFHPDIELLPTTERLYPIIHLPNGKFSTKYKSYDLMRWQGDNKKDAEKFGFVPETIALTLKLLPDQQLVLKNDADDKYLLRLVSKPHGHHSVAIKNVTYPYGNMSDFHHYYELFKDFPEDKKYHFETNDDNGYEPLNPFPGHARTCCMMACTAVLLVKRTNP